RQVLKRAADAGVIKKSVATNVLTNYRYENISNLGYAQGTCKEVVRQCTVTISKLEPVTFRNSRIVEKRKILEENTKKFDVNIEVLGALLLPTEKDVVTLEINENGAVALQDSNGNNRYSIVAMDVQGKVINVQVKADSRVLRNLSNNVVRQDSYKLIGDKATFILDVDPAFVPGQEDPNSQLVIDYIVHVCEYGWTGTCGFSSWKSLKMDSATITTSRTILTIDVPKKNKSEIVYTITRKNSRFFNDKSTSSRSTENVKMPK
ncbi:MAG: hypothetical protein J7501_04230, partial [Bdellovibrio sp.]|nr:hypothetical protein [Bdellovibrio sp.]